LALFLAGGFFRSLQFTSVNAVAYADIDEDHMSRAAALYNVAQQLSLSLGVAVGAFVLETMRSWRGDAAIAVGDVHAAFVVVAFVAALSALSFLRMEPSAGHAVSGYQQGAK
jgi:hypothetical protein